MGGLYLVVGPEPPEAKRRRTWWLLVDGKDRLLRRPKAKNRRHLDPVMRCPLEPLDYQDGRIRTVLNTLRRRLQHGAKGGSGDGQG